MGIVFMITVRTSTFARIPPRIQPTARLSANSACFRQFANRVAHTRVCSSGIY